MNFIFFRGGQYPVRMVYIHDFGYRQIADERLERALWRGSVYVNAEAGRIDDTIFFYVPPKVFCCDDAAVAAYIEQNM